MNNFKLNHDAFTKAPYQPLEASKYNYNDSKSAVDLIIVRSGGKKEKKTLVEKVNKDLVYISWR